MKNLFKNKEITAQLINFPPFSLSLEYPFNLEKAWELVPTLFKGIVSRDFGWLQMIIINRLCVPDVPLDVYSFLNFR